MGGGGFAQELEVLAILIGGGGEGATCFHPLKGGGRKMFHPALRGGGEAKEVSDP